MRRIIILAVAGIAGLAGTILAQVPRLTPLGGCNIATLTSSVGITTSNCVFSSFTAALAANGILTVSAVSSGVITYGQAVVGTGVPAGAYIQGFVPNSGTNGGVAQYQVGVPPGTTITAVNSESMTTAGIPPLANYALICAYTQNVNYTTDGSAATATVSTGGQQIQAGNCIGALTTFSLMRFFQQTATGTLRLDFFVWQ